MDFILALVALIVLSPVMLILAILVRIKLGSPVIFKQQRPGLNEKIFTMYKFRTMTDKRDSRGNLLPDAERLIPFGKFLRSTSLDELPELINILRGDMSLVGPRPLLKEYLPFYTERENLRHRVRPGITGLAQISGRNNLAWDMRLEMDVEYVERMSLALDLRIICATFLKVFTRSDVAIDTSTTEGNLAQIRAQKK